MLYEKLKKSFVVIRSSNLLHSPHTTCATLEVTINHLNVLDDQVSVYSTWTNFLNQNHALKPRVTFVSNT